MKKTLLLAILAALAVANTAQAATFTAGGLTADSYGPATKGRIFLFHGMNDTRDFITRPPYNTLMTGLLNRGWQIVTPELPFDHVPGTPMNAALRTYFLADPTHGGNYWAEWSTHMTDLLVASDQVLGPAPRYLSGGISWGGFHALLTSCQHGFDGYFAQAPVIDPNYLAEFSDVDLSNLKLAECPPELARAPGYISWNGRDTRVGVAPVIDLLGSLKTIGAPITAKEFPNLDHLTTVDTMLDIVTWTDTAFGTAARFAAPTPTSAPAASTAGPAIRVTNARRCTKARHCRNVVRRHKFFHVYGKGSKARWVYVRPATTTASPAPV